MDEYLAFDEADLAKIGVVCPACKTESVFSLDYEKISARAHSCPCCDTEILAAYRTEAKQDYNWITYYKRVRELDKNVKLRFYFRKQAAE